MYFSVVFTLRVMFFGLIYFLVVCFDGSWVGIVKQNRKIIFYWAEFVHVSWSNLMQSEGNHMDHIGGVHNLSGW